MEFPSTLLLLYSHALVVAAVDAIVCGRRCRRYRCLSDDDCREEGLAARQSKQYSYLKPNTAKEGKRRKLLFLLLLSLLLFWEVGVVAMIVAAASAAAAAEKEEQEEQEEKEEEQEEWPR